MPGPKVDPKKYAAHMAKNKKPEKKMTSTQKSLDDISKRANKMESLKVSDGMGAWIKDFSKSDAPQFKGHSKEKRRDQAIAAYLSAKRETTEGYASAAQRKAVWATRKDGGKGHPDNKKEGINPHAHLTKLQSRALSSASARAKPKSQVTLPKMPWDKDKDKKKEKKEMYGMSSSVMRRKRPSVAIEGTWHYPDTKQIAILRNMMKKPIKLGKEGDLATESIPIGDDSLYDDLYVAGKRNPNGDARPILKKWFKDRIKNNDYGLGKQTKALANKIGLKENAYDDWDLYESTNWKGTDHISLTRFSAQGGFGLQLTQTKRMGNEKFRMGAHISMPVKDIPKLIKALQTVYKAPKGTQLGDDD